MIVGVVNQNVQGSSVSLLKSSNRNILNTSTPLIAYDSFEKQNKNISFGGFRKNKKPTDSRIEKNITDAFKGVSVKGMPFLLGLATSAAMVKMGTNAKELLLDDDGYFVDSNGVTSDLITINESEGIIKFDGAGIEINANKYDVVDWENGVFRNLDGSVDIDLGANKFIDTENGIIVDPEAKISAVLDGEKFENIAIPHFPSFGSGYPINPWDDRWGTIYNRYYKDLEQEKESILDKAITFIKDLFKGSDDNEVSDIKDIFGNDIAIATDNTGDRYLMPTPYIVDNPVFKEFQSILQTDKETAVETFNNMRLQSYVDENYPSFGTRIQVYEGGRNAGVRITPAHERSNPELVKKVLNKIAINGSYYPDPGSDEAINFVKYQNLMLKHGKLEKPILSPNMLLDVDGDGIPDIDLDGDGIPDYDIDGDGLIDFSTESTGGILGTVFRFLKGLFD